jgi:hypothetical protein
LVLGESNDSSGVVTLRQAREIIKNKLCSFCVLFYFLKTFFLVLLEVEVIFSDSIILEKISIFTFSIEKYLKSIKKPIKIVYSILIAFFIENIYISKNK